MKKILTVKVASRVTTMGHCPKLNQSQCGVLYRTS